MKKTLLSLALASTCLLPAAANAWTKTYVVDWMEPAFLYGGPNNGGAESKGTDCPGGINDLDWDKLLITSYRNVDKVKEVRNAEYSRQLFLAHLGFRGPHRENIYESPTSIPDPGMILVSSTVAEGFDLDGDPNTGFTGPNGEKGIDNAFYKTSGCINFFRGKMKEGFVFKVANEQMREGDVTLVMVVSGQGADPMNDPDVQIGIYQSKDKMTKDANNHIAPDFSFRVDPDAPTQTVFKARIENGVVTAVGQPTLKIGFSWRNGRARLPLELFKSQARFTIKADGSMTGLVGGYREFVRHYLETAGGNTVGAAIGENLGHWSLPGWYYAMRRAADGLPDPATGKNAGISTVYRMTMTPAFVIDPRDGQAVKVAQYFEPTTTR